MDSGDDPTSRRRRSRQGHSRAAVRQRVPGASGMKRFQQPTALD